MNGKSLKFGDKKVNKSNFYKNKKPWSNGLVVRALDSQL